MKKNILIPAIIQQYQTRQVLMLGYMNQDALQKTVATGWVWLWSRKRKKLWWKGEKSGNKLRIKKIFMDCDKDTLLIQADLIGKYVCHKGLRTCFTIFNK